MIQQMPSAPRSDMPPVPSSWQWKALRLLSEAWRAAQAKGCNVWQFAVEIEELRAEDVSNTDLRCLLCGGYLEHARECTRAGSPRRLFQPLNALVLPKRTCFVLTAKGWQAASAFAAEKAALGLAMPHEGPALPSSRPPVPHWDAEARRLWWQERLIKEFRRPAVNQELVLAALEEEGWPLRIDDPLPQTPGIDPKMRIHDAIKALNRHHLHRIIRFGGDGSGRGIQWFLMERS